MKKAFKSLSPQSKSLINESEEDVIYTTHYYIKFKPKTNEELGLLKSDSSLILFPYPLDYEILSYDKYYEMGINSDKPSYYYASVKADKKLPTDVEWEKLEDLYIPDEYNDEDELEVTTRSGEHLEESFIETLVDKAMDVTGNNDPHTSTTKARKNWRPAGKITYYDDAIGQTIGVEGVKVKANRWFTTHTGFVDSNGNYSCDGTFKRDANYSFDFERYEFNVKGDGVRTDYNGPKITGNWNYHFARNNSQSEFMGATVFRAAYYYYYKDIKGLRRPPLNSTWNAQMNIKAFNNYGTSNAYPARRWLNGNPVKLMVKDLQTMDIYATTIHELAHCAHWKMIIDASGSNRNTDYNNADDKMCESWAVGVQQFLTKIVYPSYKVGQMGNHFNYTRVVIDLIDTELDHKNNSGHSTVQGDRVTGYSMPQIETALIGCNTWIKWRDNIKNKYNNETKQYIDALFASW